MKDTTTLDKITSVGMMERRPGLEQMRQLMHLLGNPEQRLKFVHIAGTNGKGSTAKMLASILTQAGLRTGLYTSPHLVSYNERFQINSTPISDEALTAVIDRVTEVATSLPDAPKQFELLTAVAFCYFDAVGCDLVVLEVGLGGRFDATNVIPVPDVAVITPIGADHMSILGNTLTQIAREKAGIIKSGVTVVLSEQTPDVMHVISEVCTERRATLHIASPKEVQRLSSALDGQSFRIKQTSYFLPLLGEHQIQNACTVLKTVSCLREKGWSIGETAILEGLKTTHWAGRFECVSRYPPFIIDGGHNRPCAEAIAKTLTQYFPNQKIIFLIGVFADKDYDGILETLLPIAKKILTVTPDSPRALSAESLCLHVKERYQFTACEPCATIEEAVSLALRLATPDDVICACGSLYLVGEIRALFSSGT